MSHEEFGDSEPLIEDYFRSEAAVADPAELNFVPQAAEEPPQLLSHLATPAEAHNDRSNEVFRLSRNPDTYEVTIESTVSLEDYQRIADPEIFTYMLSEAEAARGMRMVYINPTMAGGGVAMMRPPLVNALHKLGIDAHWYVMEGHPPGEPDPFLFTKDMHNVTQRQSDHHINDNPEGKALHHSWNDKNADTLTQQETIQTADIIVIDDPQPVPLITRIKATNPNAKIIWRNHIDNDAELMANPATPQGEVWNYLLESGVAQVDACIFHPDQRNRFVPHEVVDRTYLAPATVEPYDDMNRRLTDEEKSQGISAINREIAEENVELALQGRHEDMQEFIDVDRDRVMLIARFDESKGMDKMMQFGTLVREKTMQKRAERGLPEKKSVQTIIIGNGSVDDPSGIPMLEKMRKMRRETFPEDVRQDIILKRLKHNYMAINAAMYNDSEDATLVAAQLSDAEGCETRITDWIDHGIPVVVSNRGGMSLQVVEGKSGIVLDFDAPDFDFGRGAEYVSELMVNRELYQCVRTNTLEASHRHNRTEYTTVANIIRQLRIFNRVLAGQPADKVWHIREMVPAEAQEAA